MSSPLFVRTTLTIPGAGTATHVAELLPLNPEQCRMVRIVEVDPAGNPVGAAAGDRHYGMDTPPQEIVPHPDTYGAFPDISATRLGGEEFQALWESALKKFPGLNT
ncbi:MULTISPECIES: hypothetical protein [unclassified Corynebacterium]|uniref:hypothetical protein n=1 Tax=unclassified Corynebacterium TaxID=2624378 RepID=UPI0029CA915E|nr:MULTISPECIES: hypothetical protein [unclassified Corynebacterium]WPF66143.1 hypothetical protein OLX12_11445 [Corynebacterium sp. 22KM0430]WPF68636.1 hypothetical protein OLW90_11445 [Corynebacterium sp. 21KM1197]